ncbi:MAG: hypothetical protein ACUVR8_12475 [Acidobacteriota bacterium]
MPLFPFFTSARSAVGKARHTSLFWEEAIATLAFMLSITTALVLVFGTTQLTRINLLTYALFALFTLALFELEMTTYRHLFGQSLSETHEGDVHGF